MAELYQEGEKMRELREGQSLTFTRDLDGVCTIHKGDKAIYLGNSRAQITTGKSKDWIVVLAIDAPIAETGG